MSKKANVSKEIFYKELDHQSKLACCQQIKDGVLEGMDNEELKQVYLRLMQLRSREVIDLLAKRSHYFPMEMLEVEIGNQKDKEFVSYVLSKYGKKFRYKQPENAERLFILSCETDCSSMLLFLIGKGLAEGQYPRLVSGSEKLLEVLDMVRVKGLHPDTIVTFFVEAAISEKPDERIRILQHLKFDILTVNSEGLTACDVLERGIESYDYGKGRRAQEEKQRDINGLKTLQRFYMKEIN